MSSGGHMQTYGGDGLKTPPIYCPKSPPWRISPVGAISGGNFWGTLAMGDMGGILNCSWV